MLIKKMLNWNLFFFLINLLTFALFKIESVEGIIGGEEAQLGQFKFMVSIYADNEYICSGSIIAQSHVLTAANCFIDETDEFKKSTFTIRAGVVDLQSQNPPGVVMEVERIYVPKEFTSVNLAPGSIYNIEIGDIAVVKLKSSFDLSENSQFSAVKFPARIIRSYKKYFNEQPNLIGFGIHDRRGVKRNHENTEISNVPEFKLRFAKTVVHHKTMCKNFYKFPFQNEHLCAQLIKVDLRSKIGACQGDNGAPLILDGNMIIGVLARSSSNCDETSTSSLYTRVSSFLPFIKRVLEDVYTATRVSTYQDARPQGESSQPR